MASLQTMTFTIAPQDSWQYFNSPTRLKQVTNHLICLLKDTLGDTYDYYLDTEVSYPTQSQESQYGRIHYHGIITFNKGQKAQFFIEHLGKLNKNCRVEVDTINDMQKWLEYIGKNEEEMKYYCNQNKVPYRITKHLPRPVDTQINKNINKYIRRVAGQQELP